MKPPPVGLWHDDETDWQRAQDYLTELEKAWRDGGPLALSEAVKFCDSKQQVLPPWAAAAVLEILTLDPKKRARRLAGMRRKDRENATHRMRHEVVSRLAMRMTWDQAYKQAAKLLKRTDARGDWTMMRRSYIEVEKRMREGGGWRFSLHA